MKAIINAAQKAPVRFALDGRELPISLTLEAIVKIQDAFGDLGDALEQASGPNGMKVLIELLTILFNDAVEEHNDAFPADKWQPYTARQVARRFGYADVPTLRELLGAVLNGGLPDPEIAGADVPQEMLSLLDKETVEEDPDAKN